MEEAKLLIEYANLGGFTLIPNGDTLTIKNGANITPRFKYLLTIYKHEIIEVLEQQNIN